jgi:putative glycosyltransferase (TIGR04372 family)
MPAIREVVARGGYVIRLGDSSMRPLPKEKGIVDYALSNAKSEFMDLFLCGTCQFFIGTNSGLGLVPPIFGVSCAMSNWSPVGLPQWYPGDTYIPKLIYSTTLGRLMTFQEMLFSDAGWGQFEKTMIQLGFEVKDNSTEDIRELIVEMFNQIDGQANGGYEYSKINELIESAGSYKGARLSSSFIAGHPELFLLS